MNVRELAFNCIDSIYKDKSFVNIEVNKILNSNPLSSVDRSFFTALVYGTIKKSIALDYEINIVAPRKNYKPKVRTLLKMSLYQIRYMDKVPSYAIINEAVELAKSYFGAQTSSFVNAVLRKLSASSFLPCKENMDKIEYLSLINSVPLWVSRMIEKQHGDEVAINYLSTISNESKVYMRVNNLKSSKEELLKTGNFKDGHLISSLEYIADKPINELKEFMDGLVTVQSESSQMVSLFLNPKEGDYILDMCAAPGSKTYHIADLIHNNGMIKSVDVYPHRIDLLKNNLPRLGIKCVETKVYDSRKLNEIYKEESFDKILLDAPCSGLGVIRRKPDILISLSQDKLDGIIKLQKELIKSAIKLLKIGGELVYSTCTINKKENENQLQFIRENYPFMDVIEERNVFPDEINYDGFYMAKLVKRK